MLALFNLANGRFDYVPSGAEPPPSHYCPLDSHAYNLVGVVCRNVRQSASTLNSYSICIVRDYVLDSLPLSLSLSPSHSLLIWYVR